MTVFLTSTQGYKPHCIQAVSLTSGLPTLAAWLSGSNVGLNSSKKLLYAGLVSTAMGDRLRAAKPPRFVTSHSGQLNLLSSVGRKMSTAKVQCHCAGGE